MAVDSAGNVAYDPTPNVIALVEANAKTAGLLRDADVKFNDAQTLHLKEIGALRAQHTKEARKFDREQSRAIREVDQTNAKAIADQILQAVTTNAAVAERTAQTLAKQVADTAAAQETRQSTRDADTAKRLSAVELSMSKGEGKQLVTDPAMASALTDIKQLLSIRPPGPDAETMQLRADVRALRDEQRLISGAKQGGLEQRQLITWLLAAAVAILGFYTFTKGQSTATPAPQVIVVPAGTTAPGSVQTGPSTQVPR